MKFNINKRSFLSVLIMFMCVGFTFAAPSTGSAAGEEINTVVFNIVDFFNSGWVKGIACIALIAECIGLLVGGGQNPQILKKFLPLIAGTIIFMCAGKIVTLIFGASSSNFSEDLNALLLPETDDTEQNSFKFSDDNSVVFIS